MKCKNWCIVVENPLRLLFYLTRLLQFCFRFYASIILTTRTATTFNVTVIQNSFFLNFSVYMQLSYQSMSESNFHWDHSGSLGLLFDTSASFTKTVEYTYQITPMDKFLWFRSTLVGSYLVWVFWLMRNLSQVPMLCWSASSSFFFCRREPSSHTGHLMPPLHRRKGTRPDSCFPQKSCAHAILRQPCLSHTVRIAALRPFKPLLVVPSFSTLQELYRNGHRRVEDFSINYFTYFSGVIGNKQAAALVLLIGMKTYTLMLSSLMNILSNILTLEVIKILSFW